MSDKARQARQRALVIFQVQSGLITAAEGAKRLGVSRKTYYKWEQKALAAMANALENENAGRPKERQPDAEKEALVRENRELKKDLSVAQQTLEVRDLFHAWKENQGTESRLDFKKNGKKGRP